MAEKRRAGFNIPLGFYDGPEVQSIPRRIRAAAIGVWSLAGNYAATKLSDGFVPADVLKQLGCTDAIRAALKVTINTKGSLSPLWIDARDGGIQLTNWPKHQRTYDEVTMYRVSEAERKRDERSALRNGSTSENGETSGRTSNGPPATVRPDIRDPKTETETETPNGHLPDDCYESSAPEIAAADVPAYIETVSAPARRYPTSAALTVVRQVLGKAGYPQTIVNRLAIQVDKLAPHHPDALIRQSLVDWDRRPDAKLPEYLPTVLGDLVKASRASPAQTMSAHDEKVSDYLNMPIGSPERKELTP